MLSQDLDKWRITFVDTGLSSTIGERLKAVAPYLGEDEEFLATYGDGLTDAPLPHVIESFHESRRPRCSSRYGRSSTPTWCPPMPTGTVVGVEDMSRSDVRINGGFFVLKREILDLIEPGHELVEETFEQLIAQRDLVAYPWEGFFGPMDTIKDRQRLEGLNDSGQAPWRAADRRAGQGLTAPQC